MSASKIPNGPIRELRYKAPVPEIGKRTMTPEHRAAVQEHFILINHHQQILVQLQGNLREMLLHAYGVDIATGQWQIDMATGEIVQKPQGVQVSPAQGT